MLTQLQCCMSPGARHSNFGRGAREGWIDRGEDERWIENKGGSEKGYAKVEPARWDNVLGVSVVSLISNTPLESQTERNRLRDRVPQRWRYKCISEERE